MRGWCALPRGGRIDVKKGLGRDEIEDAETGLAVRKAKVRVVPNMEPYERARMEGSGAVIGVGVGAVGDTRGTWCNVRTTYRHMNLL